MSGYPKDCRFCGEKIRMSNDSGKWTPYQINTNEIHECKNKQQQSQPQPQPQQKQVQQPKSTSTTTLTLTLEDIDKRLRRIESTLFGK